MSPSFPREIAGLAISPVTTTQEITPPTSWTAESPKTPTLPAVKPLGKAATHLLTILKQIRDHRRHPVKTETSFKLAAGEFAEIEHQLGGIPPSVRYDYYADCNTFKFKMLTNRHEVLIILLAREINAQLNLIAQGSDACATFARNVLHDGSTGFKASDYNPLDTSKFEPDDQWRHRDNAQASVIIEVAHSQPWKDLRKKAVSYLQAWAQVVIGIDIDYGPKATPETTLTVWRLDFDHTATVGHFRALPKCEAFRDKQGNATHSHGLSLQLSDFAYKSTSQQLLGTANHVINISGDRLYQLIEEAEQRESSKLAVYHTEASTPSARPSFTFVDSDKSSSGSSYSSGTEPDRASDLDWDPAED